MFPFSGLLNQSLWGSSLLVDVESSLKLKVNFTEGSLISTQLNKKGEEMSEIISMVVDTILKTKKNGRITQVPPLSILRTF